MKNRIIFIGDSITDSGRREDSEGLGSGYVRLVRDYFLTDVGNPFQEVINKGISGNHITDLVTRWDRDVLELIPDYVSVSIGINDVWRQIDHPEKELVMPDRFEAIYRDLLSQLEAKPILMEPTIIMEDINSAGNQKLVAYAEIVQKLSKEFNGILVPTHQTFIEYLKQNNGIQLTTDGVHMNSTGNMLMAKTWIQAFTKATH